MASGQGGSRSSTKKSTASSNRNTSRGRQSQQGNERSGRRTAQSEPMDIAIRNEILLIVFLALAIVLFLCNFGIVGSIGNAVSNFMFGLWLNGIYCTDYCLFGNSIWHVQYGK